MPVSNYVTSVNRREGLGARVLQTMSVMLYASLCNKTYVHTPFQDIAHGVSSEEAEAFFNLGHLELPAAQVDGPVRRMAWINTNPRYWVVILDSVKQKYNMVPKECRYDPTKVNVALHVRRGDVTPRKNRYRYTHNADVISVQQQLISLGRPFEFHLFSQGELSDFEGFENVTFHLNENTLDTFHHLVSADILLVAKSAFSQTAGFLSDGVKICEKSFYPPLLDWLQLSREFTLGAEQLQKLSAVQPKGA